MTVQRIKAPDGRRTVGFQARAYLTDDKRVTRYFSVGTFGGVAAARAAAEAADAGLQRQAKRLLKGTRR